MNSQEGDGSSVCASSSIPRLQTVDSGVRIFRRKCTFALHVFPPLEVLRVVAAKSLIWTKALHSEGTVPYELSFHWLAQIIKVCHKFEHLVTPALFYVQEINAAILQQWVKWSRQEISSDSSLLKFSARHFRITVSGKWGAATQRSLTLSSSVVNFIILQESMRWKD